MTEQATEPTEIAIHSLRREEAELHVGRVVAQEEPGESVATGTPRCRVQEEIGARRRVLTEPPRDRQVVFRLAPRPLDLFLVGM